MAESCRGAATTLISFWLLASSRVQYLNFLCNFCRIRLHKVTFFCSEWDGFLNTWVRLAAPVQRVSGVAGAVPAVPLTATGEAQPVHCPAEPGPSRQPGNDGPSVSLCAPAPCFLYCKSSSAFHQSGKIKYLGETHARGCYTTAKCCNNS